MDISVTAARALSYSVTDHISSPKIFDTRPLFEGLQDFVGSSLRDRRVQGVAGVVVSAVIIALAITLILKKSAKGAARKANTRERSVDLEPETLLPAPQSKRQHIKQLPLDPWTGATPSKSTLAQTAPIHKRQRQKELQAVPRPPQATLQSTQAPRVRAKPSLAESQRTAVEQQHKQSLRELAALDQKQSFLYYAFLDRALPNGIMTEKFEKSQFRSLAGHLACAGLSEGMRRLAHSRLPCLEVRHDSLIEKLSFAIARAGLWREKAWSVRNCNRDAYKKTQFINDLTETIRGLKPESAPFIYTVSSSRHAMQLIIRKQRSGRYQVAFFNTGRGCKSQNGHHSKDGKWQSHIEWRDVSLETLQRAETWNAIIDAEREREVTPCYEAVCHLAGSGEKLEREEQDQAFHRMQSKGTCSYRSLSRLVKWAFLRTPGFGVERNYAAYLVFKAHLLQELLRLADFDVTKHHLNDSLVNAVERRRSIARARAELAQSVNIESLSPEDRATCFIKRLTAAKQYARALVLGQGLEKYSKYSESVVKAGRQLSEPLLEMYRIAQLTLRQLKEDDKLVQLYRSRCGYRLPRILRNWPLAESQKRKGERRVSSLKRSAQSNKIASD